MLFFGDWLANSYTMRDTEIYHETEGLQQYIYSFAKEFGQEEWIDFVEDRQMYYPSLEMHEELEQFIEKYNNDQKNDFIKAIQSCLGMESEEDEN
jgi:hypothetical protein